ncbi:hypothetical protein [Streptomyces wuyuanensis]|uniref:hypothetical protein n=1 Tax=Streptomyces wuyuanensis TaxID=1196353 RepID=UPI000B86880A|nr:hypothetical protein [Streptomyces wuyuanensis]
MRGVVLPEREERTLWIDGERLRTDAASGSEADLVAYDTDPALEPRALAHPSRIVLRGRVVR